MRDVMLYPLYTIILFPDTIEKLTRKQVYSNACFNRQHGTIITSCMYVHEIIIFVLLFARFLPLFPYKFSLIRSVIATF